MLIELYGLPGSGKTTLARKMAEEQGYEIIKIRKKWELILYNLFFLFKRPIKFIRLFLSVCRNSGSSKLFYYKLMNCFLDYNAKYEKALHFEKAIMDQGHHLNAFALFDLPISKTEMKKFLSLIPKPDRLLVFDISFEESLRRTKERGNFSRPQFGEEYVKKWQKAIDVNNRLFLELLPELGAGQEIEIEVI